MSSEHLPLLARLHQRSLAPLPEESPAVTPGEGLELLEHLGALQAQIVALQQQMAALTHLMRQQAQSPVNPAAQARPSKRPFKSAAPCARPAASAAAKTPPKPVHVIPRVEYGNDGRYVVICPKGGLLLFEPETPAWFAWLAAQDAFRFVGKLGHFTAHFDAARGSRSAWRAHRKIRNHTCNLRLGRTNQLTVAVLEQAAATLQAQLS